MSVLVLDGHSAAAVESVQAFGRARIVVDVAANDHSALAFVSRYPRKKLIQPASSDGFLSALREWDKEVNYQLIIPATEASLLLFCELADDDPLRCKAMLPSATNLRRALDKENIWKLAKELGVPVPSSRLICSKEEAVLPKTFPVVLKPVRSKVFVGDSLTTLRPVIAADEPTWKKAIEDFLPVTPLQEQEYVMGQGVGVETLFINGKLIWHFAHRRIHELPLTGGGSTYRKSVAAAPEWLEMTKRLLTALQWNGVAMAEFRVDDRGRFFFIELNPRFWGSLALSIDAGVNFSLGLLAASQQKNPGAQAQYKINYRTRDVLRDIEWLKANSRADRKNQLLLTRPKLLSFLEIARPLIGAESWDHFDFNDLGVTLEILRRSFRKIGNSISRSELPHAGE